MGQYHHGYSFNQATQTLRRIHPYALGRGVKAWEQLGDNVGQALIWLLSTAPGDGVADLKQYDETAAVIGSPVIGSWAGSRIVWIGDYADNDDIADWDGPPLSKIYRFRGLGESKPNQMPTKDNWNRESSRKDWRRYYEMWLEDVYLLNRYLPIADDSDATQKMLERVMHIRFKGDTWLDEEPFQREENFNKRHVARGQKRVILNLDRNEYLDVAVFGGKPTTAGMIRTNRFGDALLTSLFHPSCRGGGDLPEDAKLPDAVRGWIGRWHGDRLIATPEQPVEAHPEWPTTAAAKAAGIDMTALAKALVDHLHKMG